MSDYRRDPDDDWSRYRLALRQRKDEIIIGVMTGTMTPEQYARECGRADMIDEALTIVQTIRRGEDFRPPREQADTAISPEDR